MGTFIEFRLPEQDNTPTLRRNESAPSLVTIPCSTTSKCISKLLEAPTPTTCASESGDADLESLSLADESFEENLLVDGHFRTDSIAPSRRWADVSDVDSISVMGSSSSSEFADNMSQFSEERAKEEAKPVRRSGRARQREQRRRRIRTPSPEWRNPYF